MHFFQRDIETNTALTAFIFSREKDVIFENRKGWALSERAIPHCRQLIKGDFNDIAKFAREKNLNYDALVIILNQGFAAIKTVHSLLTSLNVIDSNFIDFVFPNHEYQVADVSY